MGALILAFACGISIGALIGRRSVQPPSGEAAASTSEPRRSRRDRPAIAPPAPTSKGRKAGLTEESFRPADDILDKLRQAAEGDLDPSVLAADEDAVPAPAEPPVPSERTIAEQRVLDRLRGQTPEGTEG